MYASEQKNWLRLCKWREQDPLSRHRNRKELTNKYWSDEFNRFCESFSDLYTPPENSDCLDAATFLFRNTVSTVLATALDESAAESLWRILATKKLTGARVGCVKEVPISEENIGHKMLIALVSDS